MSDFNIGDKLVTRAGTAIEIFEVDTVHYRYRFCAHGSYTPSDDIVRTISKGSLDRQVRNGDLTRLSRNTPETTYPTICTVGDRFRIETGSILEITRVNATHYDFNFRDDTGVRFSTGTMRKDIFNSRVHEGHYTRMTPAVTVNPCSEILLDPEPVVQDDGVREGDRYASYCDGAPVIHFQIDDVYDNYYCYSIMKGPTSNEVITGFGGTISRDEFRVHLADGTYRKAAAPFSGPVRGQNYRHTLDGGGVEKFMITSVGDRAVHYIITSAPWVNDGGQRGSFALSTFNRWVNEGVYVLEDEEKAPEPKANRLRPKRRLDL